MIGDYKPSCFVCFLTGIKSFVIAVNKYQNHSVGVILLCRLKATETLYPNLGLSCVRI